jgi:hypothetical protein
VRYTTLRRCLLRFLLSALLEHFLCPPCSVWPDTPHAPLLRHNMLRAWRTSWKKHSFDTLLPARLAKCHANTASRAAIEAQLAELAADYVEEEVPLDRRLHRIASGPRGAAFASFLVHAPPGGTIDSGYDTDIIRVRGRAAAVSALSPLVQQRASELAEHGHTAKVALTGEYGAAIVADFDRVADDVSTATGATLTLEQPTIVPAGASHTADADATATTTTAAASSSATAATAATAGGGAGAAGGAAAAAAAVTAAGATADVTPLDGGAGVVEGASNAEESSVTGGDTTLASVGQVCVVVTGTRGSVEAASEMLERMQVCHSARSEIFERVWLYYVAVSLVSLCSLRHAWKGTGFVPRAPLK